MSPHICIGTKENAKDLERLKEMGITHVLNCAKQLPSAHPREFVHEKLDITGETLFGTDPTLTETKALLAGRGGNPFLHVIAARL